MKKLFISALIVLSLSVSAQAAPFVRDTITTTNLTAANVNSSGTSTLGTAVITSETVGNIVSTGTATFVNVPPIGSVLMYGAATAPPGWILCDGTAINRTTYASLFAIISTTYGAGNGSTTFNVPDFRGVFPKGHGTTNRAAGKDANDNYYVGTIGTYTQDKLQGHKHSMAGNTGGTAQYVAPNGAFAATGAGTALQYYTLAVSFPTADGDNGTPRTGGTTEPQSLGINFIIKY